MMSDSIARNVRKIGPDHLPVPDPDCARQHQLRSGTAINLNHYFMDIQNNSFTFHNKDMESPARTQLLMTGSRSAPFTTPLPPGTGAMEGQICRAAGIDKCLCRHGRSPDHRFPRPDSCAFSRILTFFGGSAIAPQVFLGHWL
jgi:hypothetical protein